MEWMIVVFVNYLAATAQWEMQDYRSFPFKDKASCLAYLDNNRAYFIRDTNRAYGRDDEDYEIRCITKEQFIEVWERDINRFPEVSA